MPDITRQQFEAAANKVAERAPAGLSEEQFFQLVDTELRNPSRFSGAGATDEGGHSLNNPPQHEPGDYWGGFRKGLSDYAHSLGSSGLQSLAEPQTIGDFAGLATVASPPGTGATLKDFGERSVLALKTAGRDVDSIGSAVAFPRRAYKNFKSALPSEMQKVSDQMLGRRGAPHQTLTSPEVAPTPDLSDILGKYQAGGSSIPASPSPLGAKVPVEGMVGEGSSAPAASLSPVASHLQPEGPRPPIETDEFPHGLVSHSFHRSIGDLNQGMRGGQPGPLDELLLRILREGK